MRWNDDGRRITMINDGKTSSNDYSLRSQSVCVRLFVTALQTLLISTCLSSREIPIFHFAVKIQSISILVYSDVPTELFLKSIYTQQFISFLFSSAFPHSHVSPLCVFRFCSDHKMHNDKVCINFLKFCVPILFSTISSLFFYAQKTSKIKPINSRIESLDRFQLIGYSAWSSTSKTNIYAKLCTK